MGVYLFGCTEPLGLDHFKVNGNRVPVVVQQLISLVLVNQRNVGKARKISLLRAVSVLAISILSMPSNRTAFI